MPILKNKKNHFQSSVGNEWTEYKRHLTQYPHQFLLRIHLEHPLKQLSLHFMERSTGGGHKTREAAFIDDIYN
jgi:hypothetical protein